ncbi:MAG: AAA family ATPase [Erysipelotrichaceae bacterium]|nr:AAA family ATPase [Erysipelotrichaceae bacterium]
MKYYLFLLDSLESQFTLIDTRRTICLEYSSQNNALSTVEIHEGDMIVGAYSSNQFYSNIIFKVVSNNTKIKVKKIIEVENGSVLSDELKHRVTPQGVCELSDDEYISIAKEIMNVQIFEDASSNTESITNKVVIGYNKIYYGIPGCGKSWYVENKVLEKVDKQNDVFRTTFFLDYSNSDFVGQIYPVVNEDKSVSYEYVPGPFTKALERALTVEDGRMVYLVIEEINRGNAAAIFGDLFQLLDRLNANENGKVKGDSVYPISNQFIEGYFSKQNEKGKNIPYLEGNIYIPHNLSIVATMNTSDQNVFPLDTAFQRRWDREKVVADFDDEEYLYKDWYVPGTKIKWKDFAKKVNFHMIEDCKDGSITEDKNLGAYFATDAMLCNGTETAKEKKDKVMRFANNVIEYLFGTAVKFEPEILFDKKFDRYQKVYDRMFEFMFDQDQSQAFIDMLSDKVANDLEKTITPDSAPDSMTDGE